MAEELCSAADTPAKRRVPWLRSNGHLRAPFPWMGTKWRVANIVWQALGTVDTYVEPFFGTGAVLFGRPDWRPRAPEVVNDADCDVANFWRAVQAEPEAVARAAMWPRYEPDLVARHRWLAEPTRRSQHKDRMLSDPNYYDVIRAGWWCWSVCCTVGVQRWSTGATHIMPRRTSWQGITMAHSLEEAIAWLQRLQERLKWVNVMCGDWSRTCNSRSVLGLLREGARAGVFMDPPYGAETGRYPDCYTCDDGRVASAVRDWCVTHGDDERFRIVLASLEGEHKMPDGWRPVFWERPVNNYWNDLEEVKPETVMRRREVLWLSPHCLEVAGERGCAATLTPRTRETQGTLWQA